MECSVKAAIGEKIELGTIAPQGFYSYYAVHSYRDGVLKKIQLAPHVHDMILDDHIIKKPGDDIQAFRGANTTLGCYVMKFDNMEQMLHMMDHSEEWINVVYEE